MTATSDTDCCPLCDRTYDDRTDLRVHLMTTHQKSDVVDEMLAALEETGPQPVAL